MGRRKSRELPLVHLFPPSSPLHDSLFISLTATSPPITHPSCNASPAGSRLSDLPPPLLGHGGHVPSDICPLPSPAEVLPSNETLLEALDNVWLRMHSGGVYSKGALLLSTHRVIFIQNPSEAAESFLVTIPLPRVCTVSIRRRWKDKFNTLAVICRDQIGYLFVCTRGEHEIRTLEAFRRIKNEIKWRRDEDASWTGLEHFVLDEHVVRLVGDDAAIGRATKGGQGKGVEVSKAAGGLVHSVHSPSSCASDFSSGNLIGQYCEEIVKEGQGQGQAERQGQGMAGNEILDDDIASPFDLLDEYDR